MASSKRTAVPVSRKQRLLVVDDKESITLLLKLLLEEEGFEVQVAHSAQAAKKALAKERFDLLLCDVIMPGEDGFDLVHQLKKDRRTRDLPALFVTSKDEKEGGLTGYLAGGDDYISKPFERRDLLAKVRALLAGKTPGVRSTRE